MTVYVKTQNKGALNLRSEPNGAIVIQIPNGTQLEAEMEGEWSKVTYQGRTGYVKSTFLSSSKENVITKEDLQRIYNSLKITLQTIESVLK